MVHVGRKIGNFAGPDTVQNLYAEPDPGQAGEVRLSWTPYHDHATYGTYWQAVVDGQAIQTTDDTYVDGVPQDAREIEVWECSSLTRDEDLSLVVTAVDEHAVCAWDETTGDPDIYELCHSTTSGSYTDPPIHVREAGEGSYTFRYGPLAEDTHYFRLTAKDAAGNPENSNEDSVSISIPPAPPTSLTLSHNDTTHVTTLDYDASPASDLDYYAIRWGDPVELTGTPDDTEATTSYDHDNTGFTGRRIYLVHAVDTDGNEEMGLAAMAVIDLNNGVQVSRPNSPEITESRAIASGQARVTVRYDRTGEAGVAATIELYADDGAGGAVDYNSAVGSTALDSGRQVQTVEVDSSGLSGGNTYELVARAATSGDVEDTNTDSVEVTTDATAPDAPTLSVVAD
ncbi:MAG: hypothetical protein R6V05_04045 [Candidatus Brocadiia bacterium]